MVDHLVDNVAIVHQVPFTCDDLIDNSTDLVTPSDSNNFSNSKTQKHQKRFVSTLEKVCIFKNKKEYYSL